MTLGAVLRLRGTIVASVLTIALLSLPSSSCRRSVLGVCAETETRCAGDAVETCSDGDWTAPVACGAGESCSLGACSTATACVDDCTTPGTMFCAGGSTVTCGDFDSDGCNDLGMAVACPVGQFCSNGACAASCTDECSMGDTGCAGPGADQDCGDFDEDDCLDWTSANPCAPGEACIAGSGGLGSCGPVECEDGCNPVDFPFMCVDGSFTQCVTTGDADPCYEEIVTSCNVCNMPNAPIECSECCG